MYEQVVFPSPVVCGPKQNLLNSIHFRSNLPSQWEHGGRHLRQDHSGTLQVVDPTAFIVKRFHPEQDPHSIHQLQKAYNKSGLTVDKWSK